MNIFRVPLLTVDSLKEESRQRLQAAPGDVHLEIHDRTDEGVTGGLQQIC